MNSNGPFPADAITAPSYSPGDSLRLPDPTGIFSAHVGLSLPAPPSLPHRRSRQQTPSALLSCLRDPRDSYHTELTRSEQQDTAPQAPSIHPALSTTSSVVQGSYPLLFFYEGGSPQPTKLPEPCSRLQTSHARAILVQSSCRTAV